MNFLYGKPIAEALLENLKVQIRAGVIKPGLAVVLIGEDPASSLYVGLKEKAAKRIGMHFEKHMFPSSAEQTEILSSIHDLNGHTDIHGIIVQLPLPTGFDESVIVKQIAPEKDADGFHPETLERYFSGMALARPVFPRAIARLIQAADQVLSQERAVAVVNSDFFGRVLKRALEELGLTVEIIYHTEWDEKKDRLKRAKVIVSACGEPGMITGELLSPGCIVIDGGITRVGDTVLGDIDAASVASLDGWLAPVPGGVGPLTVASLLERVVECSRGV